MYSRISWAATSGLVPIGAQHGRGRFSADGQSRQRQQANVKTVDII
jgi:hypothetical protein